MSVEVETGKQLFIMTGNRGVLRRRTILHDPESAFWLLISRSRTLLIGQQANDHLNAYTPHLLDKDKRVDFSRADRNDLRIDRGCEEEEEEDEQEVPKS
jgi:hypothetical protein